MRGLAVFALLALPLLTPVATAHAIVPCLGGVPPLFLPSACVFHERYGDDCRAADTGGSAFDSVHLDIIHVRGESHCGGMGDARTHTQQLFVGAYLGAGGYHVVAWGHTDSADGRRDFVVLSSSLMIGDEQLTWSDTRDGGCEVRRDSRDGFDNSRHTSTHACPAPPPDHPMDGWGYMLP